MPEIIAELNQTTAVSVVPARERVCALLSEVATGLEDQGLVKSKSSIEGTGKTSTIDLQDSQINRYDGPIARAVVCFCPTRGISLTKGTYAVSGQRKPRMNYFHGTIAVSPPPWTID